MNALDLAKRSRGVVTARQAREAGIPHSRLSELVAAGDVIRVERGVYCLPEVWEDEFFIAQYRFARGVFSDATALSLHDFTDRTPDHLFMTFPRSYNATAAREAGITVRTCAPEVFDLGVVVVETPSGNSVRAYDLERTLCDLLRGQALPDLQIVVPAMQAFARFHSGKASKLMTYARKLGVERKVRGYLEALL